ncbi:para-nitrobenzyl esterase [Caulobacter ginsengisoli]|uniref:Carboxylic ester hydrolase n=1 Tax=Caulobacter ginsengisoli TaxID=400775 RepID=A0ABU0IVT7_9CAUL|nr:carboxylesterase family protein [Caulobacter ginsengisoli]MDQ0465134.1 para-nitrobenzyl esterase [Caulobacter ginsengisoli]
MKRLVVAIALLALAACSPKPKTVEGPPAADPATARTISGGQLVGFTDKASGAQVWRGVPFAAPPVGPLRWRAPRPAAGWSGQRASTAQAPWCPQQLSALDGAPRADWGRVVGQEDCLYLNIYAPPLSAVAAPAAKLPVMVWIHGGSNTWGRAQQYDGAALAARFKVVVVVIQYRIGALGWMSSAALREGGSLPEDASANFGTLDQIRALEWVRQDIGAFGGDASRVTIFGESAGGQNVAALLASPRAKGLFQRAIIQSGGFDSTPVAEAEHTDPFASDKVAPLIVGAGKSVTGETLRAAPLSAVFAAYRSDNYSPVRMINDGVVLPAEGIRAVIDRPATFNAVPVITGTNHDEMKLFNALNPRQVNFLFGKLPLIRDQGLYEAASAYPTRMWRVNAVDRSADAMTAGGHPAVWTYRFDWDEEGKVLGVDLGRLLGAGHSLEIPFVFGHWSLLGSFDRFAFTKGNAPTRIALSDAMMSYWVQFATTGDPGRGVDGKLPLWSPWTGDAAAPRTLLFDTPKGGGVRMAPEADSGEKIVDDLWKDPALKTLAQRCEMMARVVRNNPELRGLNGSRCKAD